MNSNNKYLRTRLTGGATVIAVVTALILFGRYLQSTLSDDLRSSYHYLDNPNYTKRLDLFASDSTPKTIVMLGDSHTSRADWVELLGRADVSNQGIGSDITEGFLNRIDKVLRVCPEICFIEGGINDLTRGVPIPVILNNLERLADTLRLHKITPVLTTVTFVARGYEKSRKLNIKVEELNRGIKMISENNTISLIDLNSYLSDGQFLLPEFSLSDDIHYNEKAYIMWQNLVFVVLYQKSIKFHSNLLH